MSIASNINNLALEERIINLIEIMYEDEQKFFQEKLKTTEDNNEKEKIVEKFEKIYDSKILNNFNYQYSLAALELIYNKDIKDDDILKKLSDSGINSLIYYYPENLNALNYLLDQKNLNKASLNIISSCFYSIEFLNFNNSLLKNIYDNKDIVCDDKSRFEILKKYLEKLNSDEFKELEGDILKEKIFNEILPGFKEELINKLNLSEYFIGDHKEEYINTIIYMLFDKDYVYYKKSHLKLPYIDKLLKNYSQDNGEILKLIELILNNNIALILNYNIDIKLIDNSFKKFEDYEMIFNIKIKTFFHDFYFLFKTINWENLEHLNLMKNVLIEKRYLQLENDINLDEIPSSILNALNKLDANQISGIVSDIQAKLKEKNIDLNKKEENTQPVTETTEENKKPEEEKNDLNKKEENKQPNEEKKGLFINIIDSIYSFIKAIAQAIIDFVKFFIPNSILEFFNSSTNDAEKSK